MEYRNYDLLVQRRKDLFAAYRDVCSRPCPSQQIAWHRTVKHPAPRYYVSAKRACNVVRLMLHGDFSEYEKNPPIKKRMFEGIYHETLRLSQLAQYQGLSASKLIAIAVRQPAPEFFITIETFRKTFRNAKRYGIDFSWNKVYELNKQYNNPRSFKGEGCVFKGKLHIITQ